MSTGHDNLEAWKRQRTVELAFELADSGRYENFADVAYALQFERGMATTQALIDDPEIRRLLKERCGDARERSAPPPEPEVVEAQPSPRIAETDHAELPQAADFERTPSFLRRAMSIVWRAGVKPVNAGDLNSAAS
ncbi:unnamed protein product [Candidatus Paraburkholderia kirkii UZHbot1]|uniref:WGS project CAFE00000000 data, contig bkir_c128 n=1 Tax=Candidatus Paraburkholderia kirkii UZHbot1 TaxID=1055526 RepID=U3UAF5_9BURK|nr:unnamed protein product [Candidatus Paraburkholderia kirkii UZHbot1]